MKTSQIGGGTGYDGPTGGRPRKDPFDYESNLPSSLKGPEPRKSEFACPQCGKEMGASNTYCQSCGYRGSPTSTGNLTNYGPDPAQPKNQQPGTNVQLAENNKKIIYNSRTKNFITAEMTEERNQKEIDQEREKEDSKVPKLEEFESEEFKAVDFGELAKQRHEQKEIEETMKQLAIED